MDSTSFIPAEAYKYIYDIVLGIICLVSFNKLVPYSSEGLITEQRQSNSATNWLYIIVALFIGFRPISESFSDMTGYAAMYNQFSSLEKFSDIGIWWLAGVCKSLGLSSSMWFAVVSFIYFGGFFLASRLLSKTNSFYLFLTILVGFSTFAYGTQGIRNGMGLSLLTLGLAIFLTQEGKWKILSLLFFIYAYFTHASCVIPLICFFVAYYGVGPKYAIYFWGLSVIISLVGGDWVANLFVGLGFDDRMDQYLLADDFTGFSHSGFRFDFLLYSIMPIWLGYYTLVRNGVRDRAYEILLSTYILANSFWVMVIRAPFSDRFAYLSWFLYPIVIAYPLLEMDIWGDSQGRKARNILLLHFGFTFFMDVIYYTILKTVL